MSNYNDRDLLAIQPNDICCANFVTGWLRARENDFVDVLEYYGTYARKQRRVVLDATHFDACNALNLHAAKLQQRRLDGCGHCSRAGANSTVCWFAKWRKARKRNSTTGGFVLFAGLPVVSVCERFVDTDDNSLSSKCVNRWAHLCVRALSCLRSGLAQVKVSQEDAHVGRLNAMCVHMMISLCSLRCKSHVEIDRVDNAPHSGTHTRL